MKYAIFEFSLLSPNKFDGQDFTRDRAQKW